MSPAGIKSLVHRMRKRLQTLDRPDEVEDEMRYLLRILSEEH